MNARTLGLALALLLSAVSARGEELMMVRVERGFPETMNNLQEIIRAHGYTVARVQRVDVGLTGSGYATAEYRLVFLGKPEEIDRIASKHPTLLAYLPLKITVFAEGESTVLLTNNPLILENFFPVSELKPYFRRWERDIRSILDQLVRNR